MGRKHGGGMEKGGKVWGGMEVAWRGMEETQRKYRGGTGEEWRRHGGGMEARRTWNGLQRIGLMHWLGTALPQGVLSHLTCTYSIVRNMFGKPITDHQALVLGLSSKDRSNHSVGHLMHSHTRVELASWHVNYCSSPR
jgi:hypothetical protein